MGCIHTAACYSCRFAKAVAETLYNVCITADKACYQRYKELNSITGEPNTKINRFYKTKN